MKKIITMIVVAAAVLIGCAKEEPKQEFPKDLIWLGTDVSGWKDTADLKVSVVGKAVMMDSTKKDVWPVAGKVDKGVCNANAWIIFDYDGKTYAATWEWLAKGQNVKKLTNKLGTYIKKTPPIPSSWNPKSGEKIGIFVSGLCRDSSRNVFERSEVVWIIWP